MSRATTRKLEVADSVFNDLSAALLAKDLGAKDVQIQRIDPLEVLLKVNFSADTYDIRYYRLKLSEML